jgi:PKD repeat protein
LWDTAWFWAFDDGLFNQLESPAHYYGVATTYYPTLTVYAQSGCVTTVTKPVTVSPIPVAAFVHSPACIGDPYQFIDSSHVGAGSIVAWYWNFGGMDSSSLQNPFFTFPDTGNYMVSLTVTSDIGCSNTLTRSVRVYPQPVANFTFNPAFGYPPLNVTFTNLTIGGSTYEWNFGDGSSINVQTNPQHVYTDTNLYAIQLIATSPFGCKDTIVKNIYVIRPFLDLAITGASSEVQDNHLQITVDLSNLGTRPINDFKIESQLEGGTTVQESYVQLLPTGMPANSFFSVSWTLVQAMPGITVSGS